MTCKEPGRVFVYVKIEHAYFNVDWCGLGGGYKQLRKE